MARSTARDGMSQYLTEISRIPLLTPREEVELAQSIQRWMAYQEQYGDSDRLPEDWQKVKRQGERAIDKMMRSNLRLVVMLAKRFARNRKTMELLDLIQEGNIGLKRAAEKFDPRQGRRFSTYAYWWIQQAIIRALPEQDKTIRIPSHIWEKENKIRRAVNALKQRGEALDVQNISRESGVSVVSIETVSKAQCVQPVSLNIKVGEDFDSDLLSLVPDKGENILDALAERDYLEQRRKRLEDAMAHLSEEERKILYLRGLSGEPKSLEAVGKLCGISRTTVGAIEVRAKRKIKHRLIRSSQPSVDLSKYELGSVRIQRNVLQILQDANKVLSKQGICNLLATQVEVNPNSAEIRQAVGRAIVTLKRQGHPIVTIRSKGYRYSSGDNWIETLPDSIVEVVKQLQGCHSLETAKTISEIAIAIKANNPNSVRQKLYDLQARIGDRLQRGKTEKTQPYKYWLVESGKPE